MAGRVSQIIAEILGFGTPKARASQTVAEVLGSGAPKARVSQVVGEAVASGTPNARVSQFSYSYLVRSFIVTQPPIYPDLPGLTFPVIWRPNYKVQSQVSPSGAEVDVSLATAPIHEFELIYSVLRNKWGSGSIEFRTMFGFMGKMNGPAGRFLYPNPHDNTVTGEFQGTGDGTTILFGPITRTFGVGDNIMVEPVGYLDLTQSLLPKVYLNGALQASSKYTFVTTVPGYMQLRFNSPPGNGVVITMDFSFFYYCKFADPKADFSEFMSNFFELQKVVLRSCRAGT